MKHYIYYLLDTDKKVRYIGFSKNPKRRLKGHLETKDDIYRSYWIQSLLRKGESPTLVIKCILETREEACRVEIALIAKLKNPDLTNTSPGGEGRCGPMSPQAKINHARAMASPETRALLSKVGKGKIRHNWSQESRDKISKSKTGQFHTPESKAKMSATRMGRPISQAHKDAISRGIAGVPRPKQREAMLGRKESPERREIQRQAALKRWGRTPEEKIIKTKLRIQKLLEKADKIEREARGDD